MADNTTLNTGTGGDTIATDDISGVKYQRVKLNFGADGSATDVSASDPLPVEISDGVETALVNASGALHVDGSAVTQPVSGTVTANLSATDNAVLDTIETNTDFGTVVGGGAEATALRVTIANDSTGVLSIDDNGGAISIDDNGGAISVDDNGSTLSIDDGGGTITVDVGTALPAGSNAIGKLAANSGVDIGDVDVTSIAAGTNVIGDVGISGARTSGGTTIYRNLDVDESEDEIKGTAGQIFWINAINLTASTLYLKFYNATAASVVVGTTTPVLTFPVPTQGNTNGAGFVLSIPNGIVFGTAITVACTTALADADTGAPAANSLVLNVGYA